jgi:hypothetical protein
MTTTFKATGFIFTTYDHFENTEHLSFTLNDLLKLDQEHQSEQNPTNVGIVLGTCKTKISPPPNAGRTI